MSTFSINWSSLLKRNNSMRKLWFSSCNSSKTRTNKFHQGQRISTKFQVKINCKVLYLGKIINRIMNQVVTRIVLPILLSYNNIWQWLIITIRVLLETRASINWYNRMKGQEECLIYFKIRPIVMTKNSSIRSKSRWF
jgi:hypothetical protein